LFGSFDVVLSHNSFEHFKDPYRILDEMKELLTPDGKLYITFGPLWFSPYGAHMHFFTSIPYVHLIFSEMTVMKARSHYRNDGAMRYHEVEGGLNKMSYNNFNKIITDSEMKIKQKKFHCIKGVNFLSVVPYLREFLLIE
jgi:SAM-dependent methyltransferase